MSQLPATFAERVPQKMAHQAPQKYAGYWWFPFYFKHAMWINEFMQLQCFLFLCNLAGTVNTLVKNSQSLNKVHVSHVSYALLLLLLKLIF